jgi:hypothetical protein
VERIQRDGIREFSNESPKKHGISKRLSGVVNNLHLPIADTQPQSYRQKLIARGLNPKRAERYETIASRARIAPLSDTGRKSPLIPRESLNCSSIMEKGKRQAVCLCYKCAIDSGLRLNFIHFRSSDNADLRVSETAPSRI